MSIDWPNFSPWSALLGGAIIGLSATLLVLVNGRIAGISGILGGLLRSGLQEAKWRVAFLAGILLSSFAYVAYAPMPGVAIDASYPVLAVAGFIVGIGTRYGTGCTSGHGVCGLSRLSPRSLVATVAFMAAGFATVFVMRHVLGA